MASKPAATTWINLRTYLFGWKPDTWVADYFFYMARSLRFSSLPFVFLRPEAYLNEGTATLDERPPLTPTTHHLGYSFVFQRRVSSPRPVRTVWPQARGRISASSILEFELESRSLPGSWLEAVCLAWLAAGLQTLKWNGPLRKRREQH